MVTRAGGVATAITSIYGLYLLFWPAPPAAAGGEISDVFLDTGTNVTVNFEAMIEGYGGERCEIRWTLFDYDSRIMVSEANYQDQHGAYITPSRNKDERADEFQLPRYEEPGRYFVKLELLPPEESDRTSLDEASSEFFEVEASPSEDQYHSASTGVP